jgi:hypothetical protein
LDFIEPLAMDTSRVNLVFGAEIRLELGALETLVLNGHVVYLADNILKLGPCQCVVVVFDLLLGNCEQSLRWTFRIFIARAMRQLIFRFLKCSNEISGAKIKIKHFLIVVH